MTDKKRQSVRKWDIRFLDLAEHVSSWSKDPSTKVGSVIVDENRIVVGMGYNGFPRGVPDNPDNYADREYKYAHIIHAEMNAVLNSNKSVKGCTLYTHGFFPCTDCSKLIIQAGIKRVVSKVEKNPEGRDWGFDKSINMFRQVGIKYEIHSNYA